MTRNCTTAQNHVNQDGAPHNGRSYGAVPILVTGVVETTITFNATKTDSTTGSFMARWGNYDDMFAPCPTNVPCTATLADAGDPPLVGASGNLYLSDLYFTNNPTLAHGTPKWPRSLANDNEYVEMKVWVGSLLLHGIELVNRDRFVGTIDLTDIDLVAPRQTITVDRGGIVTLMVSKAAFAKFGIRGDVVANVTKAVGVINSTQKDPVAIANAWQVIARLQQSSSVDQAVRPTLNALLVPLGIAI